MGRILLVLLILQSACGGAFAAVESSDPHAFVTAFIRNIHEAEDLRARGEREMAAAGEDKAEAARSSSARFATALRAQADEMNSFHLPPPTGNAPQMFATLLQQKAGLFEKYVALAEAMTETAGPGVVYEKLGGQSPDLRALINNTDETLMNATPLVFGTLINATPDAEGHVIRLTITRAQRAQLLHDLELAFGEKLEAQNQNYLVSAASILKANLHQPFKCADEP